MPKSDSSGGHPPTPGARAVLGLPLDATRDEAQRAFRRLARQTHPDAGGDPAAFRAVASAWAELGALLPHESRPQAAPAPHVLAYRTAPSRVVWAEARPSARPQEAPTRISVASCRSRRHHATEKPQGPDFATLLRAETARLAA